MWRYPDRRQLLAAIGGAALVPRIAQARSDRPLRVMLLGQSLIQRDICRDGWPGMKAIATLLRGADVVFTDLETPIEGASAGEPTRADATLHHAPPTVLDCLKALSVTLVTTANNHAWDLGTGGILSTIDALDRRGIVHAGSGRDLTVAAAPAIQHTPRGGFALVAAAAGAIRPGAAAATDHPGVNELRRRDDGTLEPADVARVLAAIRAARAAGATVLMCLHNHYWEPVQSDTPGWQKAFARLCRRRRGGIRRARHPGHAGARIVSRRAIVPRSRQFHLPDAQGRRRLWRGGVAVDDRRGALRRRPIRGRPLPPDSPRRDQERRFFTWRTGNCHDRRRLVDASQRRQFILLQQSLRRLERRGKLTINHSNRGVATSPEMGHDPFC